MPTTESKELNDQLPIAPNEKEHVVLSIKGDEFQYINGQIIPMPISLSSLMLDTDENEKEEHVILSTKYGKFKYANGQVIPIPFSPSSLLHDTSAPIEFENHDDPFANNIPVSNGELFAPYSAVTGYQNIMSPESATTSGESNVSNAIIAGSIAETLVLGFFALRLGISYCARDNLQTKLDRHRDGSAQDTFYQEVVSPVAKGFFDQVKTTNMIRYRNDKQTDAYLAALLKIINEVSNAGVPLTNLPLQVRINTVEEIVKQIKKVLVPNNKWYSLANISSFFSAEVSPKQMKEGAASIAMEVAKELKIR